MTKMSYLLPQVGFEPTTFRLTPNRFSRWDWISQVVIPLAYMDSTWSSIDEMNISIT